MATLTETAYQTRRILKFSLVLIIAFFIIKNTFKISLNFLRQLRPSPPPLPTTSFGKLPKLTFPQQETFENKPSFKLETIEGGLPKITSVGKVYFMPIPGSNLLALERASSLAKRMGFSGQPEKVAETSYRWTNQDDFISTLTFDITKNSFHFLYDYIHDPEVVGNKYFPSTEQAAADAKNFLNTNGLLSGDLKSGTAEFEYLRLSGSDLIPAISLSEADFIKVKLFRANLDNFKILPPNPKSPFIYFLFSGERAGAKRMVEVNYSYSSVEKEASATYPLKPVEETWEELTGGKGYLASFTQTESNQVTIRRISLAYYDSPETQHYLQPIYVFEGDSDFFAYIPAIDPKWTE